MKSKIFKTIFLFAIIAFNAKGQIGVSAFAEVAKIKSGTTFVVMKDPNAESVKEYINVFKENWTISKIAFIKYSEIQDKVAPENSFITFEGDMLSTFTMIDYANGEKKGLKVFWNHHTYLDLWTCDEKYFKSKKKKKFDFYSKIDVARVELFMTQWDFRVVYNSDYDEKGLIRNWGPGILKNYIQSLMSYLDAGKNHGLYSGVYNQKEIQNLKKETLYVPDYVLNELKASGEEVGKLNEKELFDGYKFKYQLLSIEELNKKILTEKTPFYYLVFVQSNNDKYISVVNSLTGEIIYSSYTPMSTNFKSEDLKNIFKKG